MIGIPYLREAGAALILVALAFSHGCVYRMAGSSHRVAMAEHLTADAKAAKKLADLTRDAANKVRAAEQAKAARMAEIDAQHEQDKTDAQAKHDRVVADLRSGAVRLRQHWQGCPSVPNAQPGSSQLDESAELRAADAGAAIRDADEADAIIRGLQQVTQADRK